MTNKSAMLKGAAMERKAVLAKVRRWHIAGEWAEVRLALGVAGSEAGSVDWRLYAVNLGRGGRV